MIGKLTLMECCKNTVIGMPSLGDIEISRGKIEYAVTVKGDGFTFIISIDEFRKCKTQKMFVDLFSAKVKKEKLKKEFVRKITLYE